MVGANFPAVGGDPERARHGSRAAGQTIPEPGASRTRYTLQLQSMFRLAPAILDVIPVRIAPPPRVSLPIHDKIPVHE